jgi:cytochrome c5
MMGELLVCQVCWESPAEYDGMCKSCHECYESMAEQKQREEREWRERVDQLRYEEELKKGGE